MAASAPRKAAGQLWEISLQENHMLAEDVRRLAEALATKRAELRKQAQNTALLLAEWGRREKADYSLAADALGLSPLTPEDALRPRVKVPEDACTKVLQKHARMVKQNAKSPRRTLRATGTIERRGKK